MIARASHLLSTLMEDDFFDFTLRQILDEPSIPLLALIRTHFRERITFSRSHTRPGPENRLHYTVRKPCTPAPHRTPLHRRRHQALTHHPAPRCRQSTARQRPRARPTRLRPLQNLRCKP